MPVAFAVRRSDNALFLALYVRGHGGLTALAIRRTV
jgi:hypothetical protein